MANTVNETAIKKLKLLFTVVDRNKTEFYLDVLSQFEVNFQMAAGGKGTATSDLVEMLGLNIHKVDTVLNCLEDKFATIRGGKGIAFAVPLSSVIGVNMYQFLSNNKQGRED